MSPLIQWLQLKVMIKIKIINAFYLKLFLKNYFAENEDKEKSIKTPLISNKINQNTDSEVVLRRTHSFETDEKYVRIININNTNNFNCFADKFIKRTFFFSLHSLHFLLSVTNE